MSVQETNFKAIADAIRQKDGTTAPIPANTFAARILAIPTGGAAGGFAVPLTVTTDPGAAVTAVNGDISVAGAADDSGTVTLTITAPGLWTVTGVLGDKETSTTVEVAQGYEVKLSLASRLPEGYTEVEYIESSGTQGFDTGLKPTSSIFIEMDVDPISWVGTFFGCWAKISSTSWARLNVAAANGYYFNCAYGLNATKNNILDASVMKRSRVFLKANGNSANYGYGSSEFSISGTANFSAIPNIGLLTYMTTTGPSNFLAAKLYSCKIYDSDRLIREFAPCIDPSGTAGLFDLVEGKFYANAGTGAFTPGPAV